MSTTPERSSLGWRRTFRTSNRVSSSASQWGWGQVWPITKQSSTLSFSWQGIIDPQVEGTMKMRVFVRTAKNMKFNKLRYSPYLAEGQFRKPSGPLWSSTLYPPKWLVPPWFWCRSLLVAGRSSDPYWGVCLDGLKSKEPGQQPPEKNAFQTSGQVLSSI